MNPMDDDTISNWTVGHIRVNDASISCENGYRDVG
jgi:hypothetical protein